MRRRGVILLLSWLGLSVATNHEVVGAIQDPTRFANVTHRFTLSFKRLLCREETNEVGSDEIAVFLFGLNGKMRGAPIAYTWWGPKGNIDKGEYHGPREPIPFYGTPQDMRVPSDMIFLVMVAEDDDGVAGAILNLGDMIRTNAALYVDQRLSRATIISKLTAELKAAFRSGASSILNDSDLVGIGEIAVTFADQRLAAASPLTKFIDVNGDGGRYRLFFELKGFKK